MGRDVRHRDDRITPGRGGLRPRLEALRRALGVITFLSGFLGVDRDWDFVRDVETPERVLVGYSMGGRLALQALIEGAAFDRAVIVSAGLNLDEEREARRARDE